MYYSIPHVRLISAFTVEFLAKIDLIKSSLTKIDIIKSSLTKIDVIKSSLTKIDVIKSSLTKIDVIKLSLTPRLLLLEPILINIPSNVFISGIV